MVQFKNPIIQILEEKKKKKEVTAEWTDLTGFIGNPWSITEWLLHETSWVPHVSLQRGNPKRSKLYHNYYYDLSLLVLPLLLEILYFTLFYVCGRLFVGAYTIHSNLKFKIWSMLMLVVLCVDDVEKQTTLTDYKKVKCRAIFNLSLSFQIVGSTNKVFGGGASFFHTKMSHHSTTMTFSN